LPRLRYLAAALGLALVQNGRRVLFIRTTDLVQRLQVARRDLELEAAINKLDKYQLLILDDIAYVTKDQAETSVLFELIAARYERRSLLITANQPFGEWGKIFTPLKPNNRKLQALIATTALDPFLPWTSITLARCLVGDADQACEASSAPLPPAKRAGTSAVATRRSERGRPAFSASGRT
jgi:hypothetical protein